MSHAIESWHTYMVRCRNGNLYTGIAKDVQHRVDRHSTGRGSKAVKAFGLPVLLVWAQEYASHKLAAAEERRVKKLTKEQKERMLKGDLL